MSVKDIMDGPPSKEDLKEMGIQKIAHRNFLFSQIQQLLGKKEVVLEPKTQLNYEINVIDDNPKPNNKPSVVGSQSSKDDDPNIPPFRHQSRMDSIEVFFFV
jgi:hypothetical protein